MRTPGERLITRSLTGPEAVIYADHFDFRKADIERLREEPARAHVALNARSVAMVALS